jgi:hypothetical protein
VLLAYIVAAVLGMIPITLGGLGSVEADLVATLGLAGVSGATRCRRSSLIGSLPPGFPCRSGESPTCF